MVNFLFCFSCFFKFLYEYFFFSFCHRDRAYLRVKETEVNETLLRNKMSRAFAAWRGEVDRRVTQKAFRFY